MGMFSWDCRRCGHPALSPAATTKINVWMNRVVALTPNGSLHRGPYDGYGRVDDASIHERGEPEVYHEACWRLAGKPVEFTGASMPSADQGWFFDEGAHDAPEPKEA